MELKKTDKGWYYVECEYAEKDVPKSAGFWWDCRAVPRKWATKDVEKAYLLRDYAIDEIKNELETAVKGRAERIKASRAVDADIDVAKPEGREYRPFQRAGIAYALERENTLIADEMGLGKTIQALGVINATSPKNVLVICPASLRLNWIIEAQRWLVGDYEYYEVASKNAIPESATFVVANYERLDVDCLDRDWDLVIVDECQKVKSEKAKRTKRTLGYYDKKEKREVPGLVDRAKRRLFLTGTPILNRPIELWPVAHKCDPKNFGSFFGYAKRYCSAHKNGYGWDFSGASNLDELQKTLRESFMVRRLKAEVLTELPAKQRQLVVLPTNGCARVVKAEQKAWSEHEDRLAELRADVDLAWASGDKTTYEEAVARLSTAAREAFAEISRGRHETALAKVPEFVEYAKESVESAGKVIVFAHHLDVVDAIRDGLQDYNPVLCTGPMKPEERQKSVDAFQTQDDCRVFIGTIGAAGVGLTLTAASTVLFCELDWVPGNMTQAEDRAHRIGQTNAVNIVHVVLDGSLDQRMAATLIEKQEVADHALDIGAEIDLETKAVVVPTAEKGEQKPTKVSEYAEETKAIVHRAVEELAIRCDGAADLDGVGFNRLDSRIGKSLAAQSKLSERQTWLALKIIKKYRRQLEAYLGDEYSKLQGAWTCI